MTKGLRHTHATNRPQGRDTPKGGQRETRPLLGEDDARHLLARRSSPSGGRSRAHRGPRFWGRAGFSVAIR
jgi:hypothetical protein